MTRASVLKKVRQLYPEVFEQLPKPQLRLVENAIVYASTLASADDLVSDKEHKELLREISGKAELTPADRLKAYRMRQELSQVQLSKRTGISQANISAMEAGRRPIGVQTAKKLAKALHCEYRQLV